MAYRALAALALAVVGTLTLAGCSSSAGDGSPGRATVKAASDTTGDSLRVPLGKPIFAQALYYTRLFDEKPFAEAVLVYLDNGAYKIVSPGEDHYGSYIADEPNGSSPEEVRFMSWPSADWKDNVASHVLTFDAGTHSFDQKLLRPGTTEDLSQGGHFADLDEPQNTSMTADWATLRATYADVFDRLAAAAA